MEASDYIVYLLSEVGKSSCVRGGHVPEISHDEVNRFLANSNFNGKALFEKSKEALKLEGGVLSMDDTVIDKPYSQPDASELIGFFRSGLHHKSVKGINLIVLNYTDTEGVSLPVNWWLYRKRDNKTKNDYFQDMVKEVLNWGLRPAWVTADSWYSSIENLKFLRNKEVGFMMGPEKNRLISTIAHHYEPVGEATIGEDGLHTHLKGFDFVKVFQTVDTEGHERYYALYGNQQNPAVGVNRLIFHGLRQKHWHIEQAFRAVKQLVQAGHFFVRRTAAIQTHLFCVLRALQRLVLWAKDDVIQSVYKLHDQLFLSAQRHFIRNFA